MRAWLFVLAAFLLAEPFAEAQFNCSAGNASNVNIGTYTGVLSTSGVTTDTATCTNGAVINVSFNQGTAPGATVTTRSMTGPNSSHLNYALYRDAARTLNWGNTPGVDAYSFTGTGSSQNIFVYPSVAGGQFVAPGTYTDTITASFGNSAGGYQTLTFSVIATVSASCTLSASALAFGNFTGVKIDAATTLAVTCTNTTSWEVGADNGQNSVFIGVYAKYMIGPSSNKLRYHLYTDAARTIEWGTTSGTNEVAGTGTGTAQTVPVYGTVGGGSLAYTPGSYSDTVIFTITF